jgi:hypothetical protein
MGREATCTCNRNGEIARVKALLEPPEMILRGELRSRIPFAKMKRVKAVGGDLCFAFGADDVKLALGEAMARKWAEAILKPPPTLAEKLGVLPGMKVQMLGKIDDEALNEALNAAQVVSRGAAQMIVARVNNAVELAGAFRKNIAALREGVPIWIVYRKGPGHDINESDVRGAGLAAGVVDVKVASVSPALTGLKFVKRRNGR